MTFYSTEPPIILPLLQRDAFNIAVHQQLHLQMQIYVFETVNNSHTNNYNERQNHNRTRVTEHDIDIQANNLQNMHIYSRNINNSSINHNTRNFHNLQSARENLHVNNSAMEYLANHSRRLNNDNYNNYSNNNIINQDVYKSIWPTFPEIGDLRSTLEFYGIQKILSPTNSNEFDDEPDR